eukprot:TRINITY_DN9865_c0_g1_i1.p1 TRINITY_DN9865_c0_g1~~TRINITY_DN9865_c0_g1_i1.p1  ORF type:complete len:155 (+),score=35.01 TRINITY_DN9865_c0_g1_i1:36-500(+)
MPSSSTLCALFFFFFVLVALQQQVRALSFTNYCGSTQCAAGTVNQTVTYDLNQCTRSTPCTESSVSNVKVGLVSAGNYSLSVYGIADTNCAGAITAGPFFFGCTGCQYVAGPDSFTVAGCPAVNPTTGSATGAATTIVASTLLVVAASAFALFL